VITHPTGYSGAGGTVDVSVCIDPKSPYAIDMVIPVQNVVGTYNALTPTTGNLKFGANNDIPATAIDFESTALHEVGHCIGLAHPNLGSESGLPEAQQNYTKSTNGADDVFNTAAGVDAIPGSDDDLRGDDVNLHWFRKSNNNPFGIAATVDAGTYSRRPVDLPASHLYAANADRTLAVALGVPNTEAVMQQGAFSDEDQRDLAHDDVATLRIGMSGLDEDQGTADDYTIHLSYVGLAPECDVVLAFDDTQSSFGVCQTSGLFVNASHVRIDTAKVYFNTGFLWHFSSGSSQEAPACPASPSSSCVTGFQKGMVVVSNRVAGRELLVAKWVHGPELEPDDFGDPTVHPGTTYTACIYDDGGTLVGEYPVARAAAACKQRDCWQDEGALGFRYRDASASASGIRAMRLQAGAAGQSRITVLGRNDLTEGETSLPTTVAGALAGSTSARIQLFAENPTRCFSKNLTDIRSNAATLFVAR